MSLTKPKHKTKTTRKMNIEQILIGLGGAAIGFIASAALGVRRENNARADGYYAGIREGRHWARLNRNSEQKEVGE